MFIPLAEVPSKIMGGGEERNYFKFYERNPDLPVEIVITRLPPFFEATKNLHKHDFVEEFSVPLKGEIVIEEEIDGKKERRHHKDAILGNAEWVVGISCENDNEATLHIESSAGNRREVKIAFEPKYTEGKNSHKVENPTGEMVTMVTMKHVPKAILQKDPLVFRVDRIPSMDNR